MYVWDVTIISTESTTGHSIYSPKTCITHTCVHNESAIIHEIIRLLYDCSANHRERALDVDWVTFSKVNLSVLKTEVYWASVLNSEVADIVLSILMCQVSEPSSIITIIPNYKHRVSSCNSVPYEFGVSVIAVTTAWDHAPIRLCSIPAHATSDPIVVRQLLNRTWWQTDRWMCH